MRKKEKIQNASVKSINNGILLPFDDVLQSKENLLYLYDLAVTLQKLESFFRKRGESKEVLIAALKATCEFYKADFCGALNVDLDIGIWNPVWWYRASVDGMEDDLLFYPLESAGDFPNWVHAMQNNTAVIIPDVEILKDITPSEYKMYKRLKVNSVIGVPYYKGSMGFLVVKNLRIHENQIGMMHVMSYCVASMIMDHQLIENAKKYPKPEMIKSDKDVYFRFFGRFEIITAKGSRRVEDLKSLQQAEIIAFLSLYKPKRPHSPLEIYSTLWPNKYNSMIDDPENASSPQNNIKSQIYRFRQSCRSLFPKKYDLIQHGVGGYFLNDNLHVITDV